MTSCAADAIAWAPEPQTRFTVRRRDLDGDSRRDHRLTRGVHLGARLDHLAHDDRVDVRALEVRAFDGRADGSGPELRGGHAFQRSGIGADGRAHWGAEDDFGCGHGQSFPSLFTCLGS